MRRLLAAAIALPIVLAAPAGQAQTVYPIDRAKVFVTLNDEDYGTLFGKVAAFIERVRGHMDNTEVFRVIAEALGLGHGGTTGAVARLNRAPRLPPVDGFPGKRKP